MYFLGSGGVWGEKPFFVGPAGRLFPTVLVGPAPTNREGWAGKSHTFGRQITQILKVVAHQSFTIGAGFVKIWAGRPTNPSLIYQAKA